MQTNDISSTSSDLKTGHPSMPWSHHPSPRLKMQNYNTKAPQTFPDACFRGRKITIFTFAKPSSRVSVSNAVWPLMDAWRNYARITTAANAAMRLYIRPEPAAGVAAFFFPTVPLLNLSSGRYGFGVVALVVPFQQ